MIKRIKELWVDYISIVKHPNKPRNNETVILAADNTYTCVYQNNIAFNSGQTKIFAIVWKPNEYVSLDNDFSVWIDKESLERSAHNFLGCCNVHKIDTNHDNKESGAFVSESYIIRGYDSLFSHAPDGTWVIALICPEQIDAKEITGVSIQAKFNTYEYNGDDFMANDKDSTDEQNSDQQTQDIKLLVDNFNHQITGQYEAVEGQLQSIQASLESSQALMSEIEARLKDEILKWGLK